MNDHETNDKKHDRTGYDELWPASEPRVISEVDAGTWRLQM